MIETFLASFVTAAVNKFAPRRVALSFAGVIALVFCVFLAMTVARIFSNSRRGVSSPSVVSQP